MRVECYAASRTQQGKLANEDSFLISCGKLAWAALCDGAGNAHQAAKKVLALFEELLSQAATQQLLEYNTWVGWMKRLDSVLLGGTQSTFIGFAVVDGVAVGACVGDCRAYLIHRGECRLLTEGASNLRLGSGHPEAFPIRQTLVPGDIVVLLSDGAWTSLSPSLLKKAVVSAAGGRFSDVPEAILLAAGTRRPDDMTAVALRLIH